MSRRRRKSPSRYARVQSAFSADMLAAICEMPETAFGAAFDLGRVNVKNATPGSDFYFYQDNGSDILAVAHLDTVVPDNKRKAYFTDTAAGPVVHSGALDDRLGAYIILALLPALGIKADILLTVGEEMGQSTASYFDPDKQYDWLIEFDRGGSDVVMYQFHDRKTADLVRDCGATVGHGTFSDIAYLDHLEAKAFNWGVGYEDYHSVRGYAYLNDTFQMVAHFLRFHEVNVGTYLPHFHTDYSYRGKGKGKGKSDFWWGSEPKSTGGAIVLGGDAFTDTEKAADAEWWAAQNASMFSDGDQDDDDDDARAIRLNDAWLNALAQEEARGYAGSDSVHALTESDWIALQAKEGF